MIKNRVVVVDEAFVFKEETHLTVLKTSLFYTGDGFTVYDCKGQLVFRVDTYGPDVDKTELVLMDPSGKCLLTVRRKVFPLFSPSIFIYFVFFLTVLLREESRFLIVLIFLVKCYNDLWLILSRLN